MMDEELGVMVETETDKAIKITPKGSKRNSEDGSEMESEQTPGYKSKEATVKERDVATINQTMGNSESTPERAIRTEKGKPTEKEPEGDAKMKPKQDAQNIPKKTVETEPEGDVYRKPKEGIRGQPTDTAVRESEGDAKMKPMETAENELEGAEGRKPVRVTRMRVPDGGWGWVIAFSAFMISILFIPQAACFGILFSQYLAAEDVSSAATSWIFNGFLLVWHISIPLVGPLCQEFGTRTVGFVATTLAVLSSVSVVFAPSPYFLYFSVSLLCGLGSGIAVSIAYIVVPPYFDKRKGLANTLLVTGPPLGQMIMAPFIRYLVDNYSFRGASLIYGGIVMHGYVVMALLHPLEWHMKLLPEESGEELLPHINDGHLNERHLDPLQEEPKEEEEHMLLQRQDIKPLQEDADGAGVDLLPQNTNKSLTSIHILNQTNAPRMNEERHLEGPMEEDINYSISSDDLVSEVAHSQVIPSPTDSVTTEQSGNLKRLWNTLARVARASASNMSLLASSRVRTMALAYLTCRTSYYNFMMLVPFTMQAAGHPLKEAAWCVSVMGITGLVTRFVVSPLTDWQRFSIRGCLLLGYCLRMAEVIGFLVSLSEGYPVAWTGLFGAGVGATSTLHNLVIVKYMGVDLLPATFGVQGLVGAVGFTILGPLIGLLRDMTRNYVASLLMIGVLDLISFLLWLLMPLAVSRDSRRTLCKLKEKNAA